jgi:hypothetical protein
MINPHHAAGSGYSSGPTAPVAASRRSWRKAVTRLGAGTSAAVVAALLVPLAPAQATLADVGPVAANGYPSYFEDASGLRLRLCDDPAQGCSNPELPNPDQPVSYPDNYAGENFYFAAATADASYEAALEAAYGTEGATPGEEILFGRIRIRMDGLVAGATYHITHPYGVLDLKATPVPKSTTVGEINYTDDQGCMAAPCGTFRSVLSSFVGDSSATSMSFLTRAGFNAATAKAGDPIGDPLTPTAVTGSPFDTNFFQVEGPNAGGPGVDVLTQNSFTIEGQAFGSADVNRPSTPDLSSTSDSGRSSSDNITNNATPTFTGTAPAGSSIDLLVDGTVAATGTAGADGSYSLSPTTALGSGTHRVQVSIANPDPAVGGTLESGILNVAVDTAVPPATIGTPRPTNGTIDPTPTFVFSSTETGSTFECSLTPASETAERAAEPCLSPLTYDDQAPGTYTFRVRAIDQAGNVGNPASYTWAIASTTPATTAPTAPVVGTATAGDASATVSWSAPSSNGGSAITGYQVQAYNAATNAAVGTVRTAASTATSLNVTGLSNGTSYKFTVRAVNATGTSPESAPSNTVTPAAAAPTVTAPGAPSSVLATAGNTSAVVSWAAPANTGGAAITEYEVQVRNGTGTVLRTDSAIPGTARSATISGLTNGTAYNFRVRAINSAGPGALSAASNSVTPSAATSTATAPAAPTIGTATAGNASATVNWAAPANTGGAAITEYRVQVRNSAGTVLRTVNAIAPTARSTTVTSLTNGTAYNFRVRAVNSAGPGALSAASNSVTPRATTTTTTATKPATPAAPTATAGVAGGAITATAAWTAPANGGSPITGYVVRALRMSSTGTVLATTTSAVQPAAARQLQMTLPVTGNYRFTVQAINAIGSSNQSPRSNQVAGR